MVVLPAIMHGVLLRVRIKLLTNVGIDDHQLHAIPLITAGGVSQSQLGPVILIFH